MNFSLNEILEWKNIIPELQNLSDEEMDTYLSNLTKLELEYMPKNSGPWIS